MHKSVVTIAAISALAVLSGAASAATVGSGYLDATFVGPYGPAGFIATGVGTAHVTTGTPATSSDTATMLDFQSYNFAFVEKGVPFIGGVVGFTNGTIKTDTGFSGITMLATTTSDDPDFVQMLPNVFALNNTNNLDDNTPEQNADVLYYVNRPDIPSLRVLEGETGYIQAIFEFGSLDLVGWGNILTPHTAFLTATPYEPVDDDFSIAPVPLPAGLPLLASAASLLAFAGYRRRRV